MSARQMLCLWRAVCFRFITCCQTSTGYKRAQKLHNLRLKNLPLKSNQLVRVVLYALLALACRVTILKLLLFSNGTTATTWCHVSCCNRTEWQFSDTSLFCLFTQQVNEFYVVMVTTVKKKWVRHYIIDSDNDDENAVSGKELSMQSGTVTACVVGIVIYPLHAHDIYKS